MVNNSQSEITFKDYYILVPLTQEAIDDLYRYEIYKENCDKREDLIRDSFKAMIFDEETCHFLDDNLFTFINAECDVMIDIYEDETVENDQLETVLELTNSLLESSNDERFIKLATEFKSLVELAINKKTVVGFYF